MEINVNFVLLEELRERTGGGAEVHIVILRESKDADSAFDAAGTDFDLPE